MVRLPLNESVQVLGDSLPMATKRFYRLENRFKVQPELYSQYKAFMEEYLQLGHMEEVTGEFTTNNSCYYLPHHPVIREDSLTTKVRVVFDASAKTLNGPSLNDIMMIGPTVQSDLATILIKFRVHKIAFCADLTKMYRQILVDPQDRDLQRIVWRNQPHESLQHFKLRTVTYGTASAPYLATRCLNQIAIDIERVDKTTADVIQNDFYIDDLLSGAPTLEEAKQLQVRIQQVLCNAGLELRKWCSNSADLLRSLDLDPCAQDENFLIKIGDQDSVKSLGLSWYPQTDELQFKTNFNPSSARCTK
ncbi:uncharacterized protein LOC126898334 [Daktulosphaira vitifoliae]|uniref:uncharacterized protein LOC126898334 n=1 Tax=Daktulosphaira vitifoliae TaxID=58002 RepID=UPI0021A9C0C1|nr:uncharacterized protein LOC126898334 [Daktulosphaira vitifoliae]